MQKEVWLEDRTSFCLYKDLEVWKIREKNVEKNKKIVLTNEI